MSPRFVSITELVSLFNKATTAIPLNFINLITFSFRILNRFLNNFLTQDRSFVFDLIKGDYLNFCILKSFSIEIGLIYSYFLVARPPIWLYDIVKSSYDSFFPLMFRSFFDVWILIESLFWSYFLELLLFNQSFCYFYCICWLQISFSFFI